MFAYVILAHKQFGQLTRLVERLRTPSSRFYIHVDRAAQLDDLGAAELRSLAADPHVMWVRSERSAWGTYGIVQAVLNGLRLARSSGDPISAVTILTGQDYPIKPVGEIEQFLTEQSGSTFMDHAPLPHPEKWRGGLYRFEDLHVCRGDRHLTIPVSRIRPRRVPGGRAPHVGCAWFTINGVDLEILLRTLDNEPRIERFFSRTWIPDEMFFQTVLLNSPAAPHVVNDPLRLELWDPEAAHPRTLGVGDLDVIRASPAFFAKKFDTTHDHEVLDRIDDEIHRLA